MDPVILSSMGARVWRRLLRHFQTPKFQSAKKSQCMNDMQQQQQQQQQQTHNNINRGKQNSLEREREAEKHTTKQKRGEVRWGGSPNPQTRATRERGGLGDVGSLGPNINLKLRRKWQQIKTPREGGNNQKRLRKGDDRWSGAPWVTFYKLSLSSLETLESQPQNTQEDPRNTQISPILVLHLILAKKCPSKTS